LPSFTYKYAAQSSFRRTIVILFATSRRKTACHSLISFTLPYLNSMTDQTTYTGTHDAFAKSDRPLKPALLRGWKRVCPNCGSGPILSGYLKVHDTCSVCSEEFHHHRADDGPAYVTILIAGHLLAPLIMIAFEMFRPDPIVLSLVFILFFVALALFLLPRIKGAFIALQWAKRMHGFSGKSAKTVAK